MLTGCATQYVQDLNHLFWTGSVRGEKTGQTAGRREESMPAFMGTGSSVVLRWVGL